MAAFIHDDIFDAGLSAGKASVTHLYICTTDNLTSYNDVLAQDVGVKATPTTTGPIDGAVNGRRFGTAAITDGTITSSGTARGWAMVSSTNTKLLACGPLSAPQAVTQSNSFTLDAVYVTFADATT